MALVRLAARPSPPDLAAAEDLAECRRWIAHHSRSFYFSSLLLPRGVRGAAWALYAFCRRADDAVDELDDLPAQDPAAARDLALQRVATLRRRLQRVYGASSISAGAERVDRDPVDRAFASVVHRVALPQALPQALLTGMEMDALGTRYPTWEPLLRYCFCVASTVGLMMTQVMLHEQGDFSDPRDRSEVFLRAADLGVAMQLTNIARDVGEDARRGRVYLPDVLLHAHGSDAAEVLDLARRGQPPSPGLRRAIAELLAIAAAHYRAADRGITLLPPSCRLAIRAARLIYAAIGDRLAERGHDSITGRAYVSRLGKLALLLRALWLGPLAAPTRRAANFVPGAEVLLPALCRETQILGAGELAGWPQRGAPLALPAPGQEIREGRANPGTRPTSPGV